MPALRQQEVTDFVGQNMAEHDVRISKSDTVVHDATDEDVRPPRALPGYAENAVCDPLLFDLVCRHVVAEQEDPVASSRGFRLLGGVVTPDDRDAGRRK